MDTSSSERLQTWLFGCLIGLLMLVAWISSYDPGRDLIEPWHRQITFELIMLVPFASVVSTYIAIARLLKDPKWRAMVFPARLLILFVPWLLGGVGLVAGIIAKLYLYESDWGPVLLAFDPVANAWGYWMSILFMLMLGFALKHPRKTLAGVDIP